MKFTKSVLSFFAALILSTGLVFSSGQININTADQQQLEMLNGIGSATATAIIEYREKMGPFNSIEELVNVKGIGDKKLEKLADHITVTSP